MDTSEAQIPLVDQVTCPTCWHEFSPEDVLWIAMHADLTEDRIAASGDKEQLRFLPSRFNRNGFARDEKGLECRELACPKCLNTIVQPLLQMDPLFLSILGAPGSGKSFYLAAVIRQLKRALGTQFQLRFQNASAKGNRLLTNYEQILFDNTGDGKMVKLLKTEAQGDQWYYTARINDRDVQLPRPYLYSIQPGPKHRFLESRELLSRVVCLYDNAGEQFLPGAVTGSAPVIDHMAKSEALLFVFDPIQDAEFRGRIAKRQEVLGDVCRDDPQVTHAPFRYPQADILAEAASRIRSQNRLKEADLYDKPLIVIVNKYDTWKCILGKPLDVLDSVVMPSEVGGANESVLDIRKLRAISDRVEQMLQKLTPQIVNEARSFASDVIFVPVSSTGMAPSLQGGKQDVDENGRPNLLFPQGKLKPQWVELPLLYALHQATAGTDGRALIPSREADNSILPIGKGHSA